MAKKAKKAKAKAANGAARTSAAEYKKMAAGIARGKTPETIGEHFRARIVEGKLDNAAILAEVKKKHKGSKASMSSLYWNRQYLMNHDGIKLD
jgi:hypothetical protein